MAIARPFSSPWPVLVRLYSWSGVEEPRLDPP